MRASRIATEGSVPTTLAELLRVYLDSGDEDAMERFVARTRPRLLRVAGRIGDPADAEDSVQSAYLSLIGRAERVLETIPADRLEGWLVTAVVRIAYRRKALRRRQADLARTLATPTSMRPPEGLEPDEAELLHDRIRDLPPAYRDPLILRYLHGMESAEAASLLGLSEGALRVRLHRGRRLLRARWATPLVLLLLAWPEEIRRLARTLLPGGGLGLPAFVGSRLLVTLLVGSVLAVSSVGLVGSGVWRVAWVDRLLGVPEEVDVGSRSAAASAPTAADPAAFVGVALDAETSDEPPRPSREPFVRERRYVSGPLKAREGMLRFRDGPEILHGEATYWFLSGEKELEGRHEKDVREGEWISYHETGERQGVGRYLRDERDGLWTYYHSDGTKESAGPYVADAQHGEWTEWHENGEVSAKGSYIAGSKHGEWKEFHETGDLAVIGTYDEALEIGLWKLYHPGGERSYEIEYEDGEFHGKHVRFNAGKPAIVAHYDTGRLHGEWTEFAPDGKPLQRVHYHFKALHGLSEAWYPGGVRRSLRTFRMARPAGLERHWHANGRLAGESVYTEDPEGKGPRLLRSANWAPNGQQTAEIILDGPQGGNRFTYWYENGQKAWEQVTKVVDGRWSTSVKHWYTDGSPTIEGLQVKGRTAGRWRYWLRDGTLYECSHRDGKAADGVVVSFMTVMPELPGGSVSGAAEMSPIAVRTFVGGVHHGLALDLRPEGKALSWGRRWHEPKLRDFVLEAANRAAIEETGATEHGASALAGEWAREWAAVRFGYSQGKVDGEVAILAADGAVLATQLWRDGALVESD